MTIQDRLHFATGCSNTVAATAFDSSLK